MRAHRVVRIFFRSLTLALFTLALLARNITGAPNAQIAFSEAIYEKAIQSPSAESIDTTSESERASIQGDVGDTSIFSEDEEKTQYRKTLCPDRPHAYDSRSQFRDVIFENFYFTEDFFPTTVPSTVHAQAPPKADASAYAFSHFYFKGALHLELPNDNQCGWRIGFDRLRT